MLLCSLQDRLPEVLRNNLPRAASSEYSPERIKPLDFHIHGWQPSSSWGSTLSVRPVHPPTLPICTGSQTTNGFLLAHPCWMITLDSSPLLWTWFSHLHSKDHSYPRQSFSFQPSFTFLSLYSKASAPQYLVSFYRFTSILINKPLDCQFFSELLCMWVKHLDKTMTLEDCWSTFQSLDTGEWLHSCSPLCPAPRGAILAPTDDCFSLFVTVTLAIYLLQVDSVRQPLFCWKCCFSPERLKLCSIWV